VRLERKRNRERKKEKRGKEMREEAEPRGENKRRVGSDPTRSF
jgi:hypothetical protein